MLQPHLPLNLLTSALAPFGPRSTSSSSSTPNKPRDARPPTHGASDVIDDHCRVGVPIVHRRERLVPFLSCCVPDLRGGEGAAKRECKRARGEGEGEKAEAGCTSNLMNPCETGTV